MAREKTTLTVAIEYDPAMTDPEGLAVAMDRLLETALSTPGILDDYGDTTIGEFFIAEEPAAEPTRRIVLSVSGGVLQEVFSDAPAITVTLVDWDTEGCSPAEPDIFEISDERDGTQLARVVEHPVSPLERLAGSDSQAALTAAGMHLLPTGTILPTEKGKAHD